jgi:hypothetical protein
MRGEFLHGFPIVSEARPVPSRDVQVCTFAPCTGSGPTRLRFPYWQQGWTGWDTPLGGAAYVAVLRLDAAFP